MEPTSKEFALLLGLWSKEQAILTAYSKTLDGDWLRKASEPVDASLTALLGPQRAKIYRLTEIVGYPELDAIVKKHKLPMETLDKFVALREKVGIELYHAKPGIRATHSICVNMRRQVRELLGQAAYDEFKVVLSTVFSHGDHLIDD